MSSNEGRVAETARAKINLALHVVGRRADGYHALDSLVAFAEIGDRLSFELAGDLSLDITGPFAPELADGSANIAHSAAQALIETWPGDVRPAAIRLEKNLPVASGIGGGSADAAAVIRGLLRLSGYKADQAVLQRIALQLGADVPVCLTARSCRMSGIGEALRPIAEFPRFPAVLVNPKIPVGTPEVFARLGHAKGAEGRDAMPDLPHDASPADWVSWLLSCRNDLQGPAIALVPRIADVLRGIADRPGNLMQRMSGSGATCFGLFASPETATAAASRISTDHPDWWVQATSIG